MKNMLKRVMAMPDDKIKDDDHLHKPDITQKEFEQCLKEIIEKHKNDPVVNPKSNAMAEASIKSLNKEE